MKTMLVSEFKAKCIAVLKEVQRSREPLVITLRGKPLVTVRPVEPSGPGKRLPSLRLAGAPCAKSPGFGAAWNPSDALAPPIQWDCAIRSGGRIRLRMPAVSQTSRIAVLVFHTGS